MRVLLHCGLKINSKVYLSQNMLTSSVSGDRQSTGILRMITMYAVQGNAIDEGSNYSVLGLFFSFQSLQCFHLRKIIASKETFCQRKSAKDRLLIKFDG